MRTRLTVSTVLVSSVCAWDPDGLSAVGMTTMSGIQSAALSQLKRLLGSKDVVDISHWSASVMSKYPGISALFYQRQNIEPDGQVLNCSRVLDDPSYICPAGHCLIGATQHFYVELMNKPSLSPMSSLPVKLKLSDSDRLKFFISLLAQLHSPSLYGYTFNRGGQDQAMKFLEGTHLKDTTLFDYWERQLVAKTVRERPSFWYSGWTHFNSLGKQYQDTQQKVWDDAVSVEDKLEVLKKWGAEMFTTSCLRIHRNQAIRVASATSEADLLIGYKDRYTANASTLFMDFEYLKSHILIAGTRSAIVINSLLANSDAKKLRQGTNLSIKIKKENLPSFANEKISHGSREISGWATNLAINSSIILCVLAVFGIIVRTGSFRGQTAKSVAHEIGKLGAKVSGKE